MVLEVHFETDVGRVREKNEDSFLSMPAQGVYVVADGMGGHNSGEIASQISVEAIKSFYESDATDQVVRQAFGAYRTLANGHAGGVTLDEYRLRLALEAANLQIFNTARRYVQFRDMGTTVVAVQFVKNRIYVGYVGDSRVYRVRDKKIVQLTEDHSLANEYVKMKLLRKEDVPRFPYKNVIVRALGLGATVKVDTFYKESRPGDWFLLCSDGLTDLVRDPEIRDLMLGGRDVRSACRALVDTANARGGVDNITVLAVHVARARPVRGRRGHTTGTSHS